MRKLLSFAAAAWLLAACASAPSSPPAPAPEAAAAPASPSLQAQLLAAAGRADAPSQAEVERAFGAPDISRRDGAGAALTYRLPTCALLLLFSADARNEMRLAQAHAGPRRSGDTAPTLERCAAEAAARRS